MTLTINKSPRKHQNKNKINQQSMYFLRIRRRSIPNTSKNKQWLKTKDRDDNQRYFVLLKQNHCKRSSDTSLKHSIIGNEFYCFYWNLQPIIWHILVVSIRAWLVKQKLLMVGILIKRNHNLASIMAPLMWIYCFGI